MTISATLPVYIAPYSSEQWSVSFSYTYLSALTVDDGDTGSLLATATPQSFDMAFDTSGFQGAFLLSATLRLQARHGAGAGQSLEWSVIIPGSDPAIGDPIAIPSAAYQLVSGTVSVGKTVGTWLISLVTAPSGQPFGHRVTYAELGVTYSPQPLAPTLGQPSGVIGTLTPTFQTTPNYPTGGDTVTDTQIEVRRVSDNALFWLSPWVSGTSVAYAGSALTSGTAYYWRARHRNTYGAIGLWSDQQQFTPSVNSPPVASPTAPVGNAIVGTSTPSLQWSFSDPDGDTQSAYQVQVRRYTDQVMVWDPGQLTGSSTAVTYSGPSLSGGVRYEWRVRGQDSKSAWSNYSAWESFTPQAAPNPPSGIQPLGMQHTLTPQVSGTYHQGTGGAQAGYQYEIRQGTLTIYQSGDVTGDIAVGQPYGTDNPNDTPSTPPALNWGTSYEIRARSKDVNAVYSGWSSWQAFRTNAAPTTPSGLQPDGAVTGATSPVLSWTHNDPDGDAQTAAEIELRRAADDVPVTGYAPKALTQSATSHQVTETLTASPATAYKWRVRTKATEGPGFSPWSEWKTFTVTTAPALTISNPTPDAVVPAPQLVISWTLSGGSGVQQVWRVLVFAEDQSTVIHDSGEQSGTASAYQLATGILRNNRTYYVQIIARDTLNQEAQTSKVRFTTYWTPPPVITGLQAQAIGSQG